MKEAGFGLSRDHAVVVHMTSQAEGAMS
jgi:hypothetical protein